MFSNATLFSEKEKSPAYIYQNDIWDLLSLYLILLKNHNSQAHIDEKEDLLSFLKQKLGCLITNGYMDF